MGSSGCERYRTDHAGQSQPRQPRLRPAGPQASGWPPTGTCCAIPWPRPWRPTWSRPRHAVGDRWWADETSIKVAGRWRYTSRAIDQSGQVIDALVPAHGDVKAARRFFQQAIGATKATPVEVVTDRAPVYPAARHCTDQYANNRIEADHGRVKARLRSMRGLEQDRNAGVVVAARVRPVTFGEVTTNWPSRSQRTGDWPRPASPANRRTPPAVGATEGVQSPLAGARRSAYGLSAVTSADGCMLGRSNVDTSW
jgi:hypothetical protein